MTALLKRALRPFYWAIVGTPQERQRRQTRRRIEETLARYPAPYRLNLGCGRVPFAGWLNIDLDAEAADCHWDLTQGIPVPDGSCSMIYCEHLLEHLNIEQGVQFLKECKRALVPNGVARIAMPSLDDIIEKAAHGNWRDQDWLSWPDFRFIETRAEMLNISFRWWGHQWLYDREELHRRLGEAGFQLIKDTPWGSSEEVELCNRETRKDSLLICEAVKSPSYEQTSGRREQHVEK